MSLELVKDMFSGKYTHQIEKEDKEETIKELEKEADDLSNQVLNLENEKNNLVLELNKARYFENGVFSTKEKDYINKIQSKEDTIKEIKSEVNSLYTEIDEQQIKISNKNETINKYTGLIREMDKNIAELDYKLNYEQKNSKKIINESKSEKERVYKDYINNLDAYENAIISKNEIISSYSSKLKGSLHKLKEANNLIINLKKDVKINKNVRQELREKNEEISNLNGQVYSLSKEVKHLSDLSYENSILESKLQKSENFENSLLRVDEYKDKIKVKDDIIDDKRQELLESIKQINNLSTKIDNLQLVSSNVDLSGLEVETANESRRAFLLKDKIENFINSTKNDFSYIFIDCPPSLSLLTIMSLVVAKSLIVPLQAEFFALEGLSQLMQTIDRVKNKLNPKLEIRGVLITMFDKRNKLSAQVEADAREFFKEKVYQTVIPRNVRLSEAPSHGVPILIYDKLCAGSKSYSNFTDEFLKQENIMESAA